MARSRGLPPGHGIEVIVAANGCRDRTVAKARGAGRALRRAGFSLRILDLAEPGKALAINAAEDVAAWPARAYLDADVIVDEGLLFELASVLCRPSALFTSGSLSIPPSDRWSSRAYARVWSNLPFVRQGVPGVGFYAVTAAGRARWGRLPEILSDDRFVRLQFAPHERIRLRATYAWRLPDGLVNLVRARWRWCSGNRELARRFPELVPNDSERNRTLGNALALLGTPVEATVFVAVYLLSSVLATLAPKSEDWVRARA